MIKLLAKLYESTYCHSMDQEQTAPIGAVCSGSTRFASILNLSVMQGNYLQQTTLADDVFRCIFGVLRVKFDPSLDLQCTAILRVLEQRYFGICSLMPQVPNGRALTHIGCKAHPSKETSLQLFSIFHSQLMSDFDMLIN